MAMSGILHGREQAFSAVAHRFPQAELAIRRLMSRNEDFCDLCEELAEAEAALAGVADTTPADLREQRAHEWQELIDLLVAEVRKALRNSEEWMPGSNG